MNTAKWAIVEKVSNKGNAYTVLQVTFENGYVFETFLTREQVYILSSIVKK